MNGLEQIEKLFRKYASTLTALTDDEIYKDDKDFCWALVDATLPEDICEGVVRFVARTKDSGDLHLIVVMYDVGTEDMSVNYFYVRGDEDDR